MKHVHQSMEAASRQLLSLALVLALADAAAMSSHHRGLRQGKTSSVLIVAPAANASNLASLHGSEREDLNTQRRSIGEQLGFWTTTKAHTLDDYVATFEATGCPNRNPDVAEWWKTQADETVLADMYSYCKLTKAETATREQKVVCCGDMLSHESKCPPSSCTQQTKMLKASREQTAEWYEVHMPHVNAVDSLAEATDGWLDWFIVLYWLTVVLVIAFFEFVSYLRGTSWINMSPDEVDRKAILRGKSTPAVISGKSAKSMYSSETRGDLGAAATMTQAESTRSASALNDRKVSLDLPGFGDEGGFVPGNELHENFWALNLIAAIGNARDVQGGTISPWLVFFIAIFMGLIQSATLLTVMYDIDPAAKPYTETPTAPWKESAFTVNLMKFIMVFYLGLSVVAEAGDAHDNATSAWHVDEDLLHMPRSTVMVIPIFHYLVTLNVIMAGVSVILSCQAVPEILACAMAILFITQVDELLWYFFQKTFDVYVEDEWKVPMPDESETKEALDSSSWQWALLKKCVILFPMMWGFCLLGRAWYRDAMPAAAALRFWAM